MIAGKDVSTHDEAINSRLTGTIAGNYYAITQFILGVRPTYQGLMVAPAIPTKWKEFSVARIFKGICHNVSVKREGKGNNVRLIMGGKAIESNIIPDLP